MTMRFYYTVFFFVSIVSFSHNCLKAQVPITVDSSYTPEMGELDLEDSETLQELIPVQDEKQEAISQYYKQDIPTKNFDEEKWKNATNGLDYSVEPEKPKSRINFPELNLNPAFLVFIKWFFIIAGVLVLAFIVLKFVNEGNIFSRQSRNIYPPSVSIDLEKIEDDLQNAEFNSLIQKAINQKQYALAIRLYYLATIKELNMVGAIKWKKDKTNSTYVREMRQHTLFEPFRHITGIFEQIWYGDRPLEEADFYSIQPVFKDVLAQSKKPTSGLKVGSGDN